LETLHVEEKLKALLEQNQYSYQNKAMLIHYMIWYKQFLTRAQNWRWFGLVRNLFLQSWQTGSAVTTQNES